MEQLVLDENTRQREFPIAVRRLFLAHAAVAPLPRVVVGAITAHLERAAQEGQFGHLHAETVTETRRLAARLLDAQPEATAFVTSTSTGLSLVAAGIRWQRGDGVLIPEFDFPANRHPWLALRGRGVEVRSVPHRPDRGIGVDDILPLLQTSTRLVSLSSVHFLTGQPTDVEGIGALLRERRVMFCVDAIQSLGALPFSSRHADFVTAGAQKWLLGPQGIGLLVVNRRRLEELDPLLWGWKLAPPLADGDPSGGAPATAERYEAGTINVAGIAGLHAALRLLEEIGVPAVARRLALLRRRFVSGLERLGYEVLGSRDPDQQTCITSFRHEKRDLARLRATLEAQPRPIVLSERSDHAGNKVLRFAPHFYNTESEIDTLLDKLR